MEKRAAAAVSVVLVLLCGAANALEIVPHPGSENPVDPYQNVRLDVVGATLDDLKGNSEVLYPPMRGVTVNEVATWDGEPYLLFESQSLGRYWLALVVVVGGKLEAVTYMVEVAEGPDPDPQPDPDPEPDPEPDPDPDPEPVEELWSIVVGETGTWTAGHAIVLTSKRLRGLVAEGRFRVFDKDLDTNASAEEWIDRVPEDAPLPHWFLLSNKGRIVYEGPLPESVDKAVEIVERHLPTKG